MTDQHQTANHRKQMPLWLRLANDGSIDVVEERAATIRQIYAWSAEGFGALAIAKRLNETVTPWKGSGDTTMAVWRDGYIRRTLASRAVEGTDAYPRIVSAELVRLAREAASRRSTPAAEEYNKARNLFAGRVWCGHCGDTMVRITVKGSGKRYEYLRCVRYGSGGPTVAGDMDVINQRRCANSVRYRYDVFERAVLKGVIAPLLDINDDSKPGYQTVDCTRLHAFQLDNPRNAIDDVYFGDADRERQSRTLPLDYLRHVVEKVVCTRSYVDDARRPNQSLTVTLQGSRGAYLFNARGDMSEITLDDGPRSPT